MAVNMRKASVTRVFAFTRMTRNGSAVFQHQTSADLSHTRRQRQPVLWVTERNARSKGKNPTPWLADYDPRAIEAGRPRCLVGVSGVGLANLARPGVLSRRTPTNSWTAGISSASLRG